LNQESYRRLISGQSKGIASGALRLLLGLASLIYRIIIFVRNYLYSSGRFKKHRAESVVISVGNITAGGTGKTPLVIWLCKYLESKKINCAIFSRGYKTDKGKFSDEPAILARSCPDAKIIVNCNRVEGASEAINKFGTKVCVMDDGFQHRRLCRELDIVTIDAIRPFGFGRMLPAGLLRESVKSLRRANAVVITRCDQVTSEKLKKTEEKLLSINPSLVIAKSTHSAVCVKRQSKKEMSIEEAKGRKVFAFCGIGNPDAFLKTINGLEFDVVGWKIYNDHYRYQAEDIEDIYEEARYFHADMILSTEKDWNKAILAGADNRDIDFSYLAVELEFTGGEERITELIDKVLSGKIQGL